MALVTKNDVTQIFAIQAPSIDLPPTFANYPRGWDAARSNNGKPTIKQFNYIQQRTDQNVLWIHQNGAALPYDATMEYAENAHVVKDGELQKKDGASWVSAANKGYNLDYFVSGKSYPLHAEIMLTNGDIVKSTISGNTNDPNEDMTGWVNTNSSSQILDESGRNQQQINDLASKKAALYADVMDSSAVKGDGLTSDSAALQAYADALQTSQNATTFIPMRDKSYLLTAPVVYQEPCMIFGDKAPTYNRGQGTKGWIIVDSSAGYAFDLGNQRIYSATVTDRATKQSQNEADQWTIKNIGIIQKGGVAGRTLSGIKHTARNNGPDRGMRIVECSFRYLDKPIWITDQSEDTQLANLDIQGCVAVYCNYAVFADGNTFGLRVVGNQFEQNVLGGIHGTFNGGVTIEDNMLEGQINCINLTIPPRTGNRPKISIARNYFESNTGDYLIKVASTTAGHLVIDGNFHFNINNNAALQDVVLLSGGYEHIRNTDNFKITFYGTAFVAEDSLISKDNTFRFYLGAGNKGALYNSITEKAARLGLVDSSYSVSTVSNYSQIVATDYGEVLYAQTANNFTPVAIPVANNDAFVMHIAYYDDAIASDEVPSSIQIWNNAISAIIAEGAFSIARSCGKIKVLTLHFISPVASTNLQVRFVGRSDTKIISVAAKKLGVFDGVNKVRFDSEIALPPISIAQNSFSTAAYTPPSIPANGGVVTATVAMLGVAVGTPVAASFDQYNENIDISAVVSSVGVVTVKLRNTSATAITLPSGTLKVKLA